MSRTTIERKFANPHEEISKIQNDLMKNFGQKLAWTINETSINLAKQIHERISFEVLSPFVEMSKVVERLPKNATKQQYHQFLEEVFKLSNPQDIMKRIDYVLKMDEVVKEYNHTMEDFENLSSVKGLFEHAKFSSSVIKTIQQNAMTNISNALDSLHHYVDGLRKHQQVMKEIAESRKGKTVLKTGASLVGLGLGIPFLGLGLGALMNAGDRTLISNSIDDLLGRLDFMSEKLTDTVIEMDNSLHLMYLTLIGGTVVAANEVLKRKHMRIEGMKESGYLHFELSNEEKERFTKWVYTHIDALEKLGAQKRFKEAITLAKAFFQEVYAQPVHAQALLSNKHTAIYMAHTYYYAIFQEVLLEEYRNGHIDSFVTRGHQLIKSLQFELPASDLPKFASDPNVFMLLLLKKSQNFSGYQVEDGMAITFIRNVVPRIVDGHLVYEEEQDGLVNSGFLLLILYELHQMKRNLYKYELMVRKNIEEEALTVNNLKFLIKIDESLGINDEITIFLRNQLNLKRGNNFRGTIRKMIVSLLMLTFIAGVAYGGYKLYEPASEKVKEIWLNVTSFFDKEEVEEQEVQYVIVTNDTANIRNMPNYAKSSVIATATFDDTFEFTGLEMSDESGENIIWLEIILEGSPAYISKKLVKYVE